MESIFCQDYGEHLVVSFAKKNSHRRIEKYPFGNKIRSEKNVTIKAHEKLSAVEKCMWREILKVDFQQLGTFLSNKKNYRIFFSDT